VPMLLALRHFLAGTEGQIYWYHPDGRGSVAGLTKHQGQSTHNYRYDAYGQLLPAQGNWTDPHNHYTFAGKEWDEHLGLYEFGLRLYDPWAGVWLTREPLPAQAWKPRTWHRYQYACASPISYYDPYGLQVPGPEGATPSPCLTPPPITVFVWQMMQEALQSRTAQWIRFLNQTCYQCAWEGVPWWARGEGYTTAVQADAFSRLGAYAFWTWMVRQGGPWDLKPKIAKEYEAHYFRLSDGYVYYYDVWGNVMYGYLGVALGFSEEELFHGAGAEQIGSDIGYTILFLDPSRLPRPRIAGAEGLAAFDHPPDAAGISIGVQLWKTYGPAFTPEILEQAIISQGERLERRP